MNGRPPRRRFDLVVIGGGLAGLQAAVTALEDKRRVGLAVKRRVARSGSSGLTSAGYASVMPEWLDQDSPDDHFRDTLRGGADIGDPDLVKVLVDEGPEMAKRLEARGGAFRRENGTYQRGGAGDHSVARSLGAENWIGTDYTVPLAAYAESLGLELIENTMAIELLVSEGRVRGALCLDLAGDQALALEAPAVVLATGGCGQLFPVTSNPTDVTGDGFALAARAGAELRDMEFIQFYPFRCLEPFTTRFAVQPSTFLAGGMMYNSQGERFMKEYDPERLENTTRDVLARAIFDQIRKGLDIEGGVMVDLAALSEEDMERTNPKILAGLRRRNLDYRSFPLRVTPEAHYFMGGVRIDIHGRSTVPGLYAAGEVAGGIQGANRLSNNALPEALVFGHRAAMAAAGEPALPPLPDHLIDPADRLTGGRSEQAGDLRQEMHRSASQALGIIRNADELEAGMDEFEEIRDRLRELAPEAVGGHRAWLELDAMSETGVASLTAAQQRTESRGAHYREDYPMTQEAWTGSLGLLRQENGRYDATFVPTSPAHTLTGQTKEAT